MNHFMKGQEKAAARERVLLLLCFLINKKLQGTVLELSF